MKIRVKAHRLQIYTAVNWAFKMRALRRGETVWLPVTLVHLDYKFGDERGQLPLRMPAGTYTKSVEDDLVIFRPD